MQIFLQAIYLCVSNVRPVKERQKVEDTQLWFVSVVGFGDMAIWGWKTPKARVES
jgi:hypothetical protein